MYGDIFFMLSTVLLRQSGVYIVAVHMTLRTCRNVVLLFIVAIKFARCVAQTGPAIFSDNQWAPLEKVKAPQYPPPTSDNWKKPTTEIYISIADFIDTVSCAKTLNSYISKAKYPGRLKFGESVIWYHFQWRFKSIHDTCTYT